QGLEQGLEQGIQKGESKGRLAGQAELLERQLVRRFGGLSGESQRRLAQATREQLQHWADRVLDAQTLGEVFEEH
ncbi:MAG: DUF4351 domain-containing protein, partial [Chromatiaceae bacterium]|nr:DUF4351 domain-containing protein [Chromatiaceae bacterium]